MIKILSESENSDGYIISPTGVLLGKVFLPKLILIENKSLPPDKDLFTDFLSLNENQNILDAIDLIKDFVGESVPVVDNNNNIVGIVTESDLFNQLLIAENIRKKEELSD